MKVADLLIRNNKKQIQKDLYSDIKEQDGKVKLLINKGGMDEAEKIAYIIKKLIKDKKCEYKDIAILYRTNIQSYPFQKIFFKRNIPHKLCNRIGFFETKIVVNIFSYLKFIINPNLDFCLQRIINYPPRNIGEKTQKSLFSLAKNKNINCWEIIKNCDNKEKIEEYEIDKDLQKKLLPFKNTILYLISIKDKKRVSEIIQELVEYLELKKYLINDSSSIEKINMLIDKVEEMELEFINFGGENYTLSNFLDQTSLLLGNEENYDKKSTGDDNKVKLMTIHQAKGLEFTYVFVVGLEEGFYPCSMCDENDDEIEEERRILYVAITRAKVNCYISYAKRRLIGDETKNRFESRFIKEINNNELIEIYNPPLYEKYWNKNKKLDELNKKNENEIFKKFDKKIKINELKKEKIEKIKDKIKKKKKI